MTSGPAGFPGATSVTRLDVYGDTAPDGVAGGTPHMHLASTECYLVIGGAGALETLDASGPRSIPLAAGDAVWFTPGTIHRAVNHGGLEVLVLMDNAGLPEAGDAVMTFPPEILSDPDRYRAAAALPERDSESERERDASARRDLAVQGFLALRAASAAGDDEPLRAFHEAAAALKRLLAPQWAGIVASGPLARAAATLTAIGDLGRGSTAHLATARVDRTPETTQERLFGMCGRLRPYRGSPITGATTED